MASTPEGIDPQEAIMEPVQLAAILAAGIVLATVLRGGLNVSLGAVFANLGLLALRLCTKLVPKLGMVGPLARRFVPRHAAFTTLLMSTGLTFGTISALYGLNAGIIDRTQFSLLVTVVALCDRPDRDRPALL